MMQLLVVTICLLASVGYAGWRIRQLMRKQHNPCCGCDGCSLKNQVCDKKTCEKFGYSK
jgi:hypothetical protein